MGSIFPPFPHFQVTMKLMSLQRRVPRRLIVFWLSLACHQSDCRVTYPSRFHQLLLQVWTRMRMIATISFLMHNGSRT